MPSTVSEMGRTAMRLAYQTVSSASKVIGSSEEGAEGRQRTYLISGQGWMVIISPCFTRRLCRTTLFIRALPSSSSSSARTIRAVSFLFFPRTRTVSPRKSSSISMVADDRAITLLSSFTASVTLKDGVSNR